MTQSDLGMNQQAMFLITLDTIRDVFATSDTDLGRKLVVKHQIQTEDVEPLKQRAYRVTLYYRQETKKMLKDMLDKGVIEPFDSPRGNPVVLVSKKDGSLRFCVDYRKLNALTGKDSYPLFLPDHMFCSMGNAELISTVDLQSGFWQVDLTEDA